MFPIPEYPWRIACERLAQYRKESEELRFPRHGSWCHRLAQVLYAWAQRLDAPPVLGGA